jgi:hypothetical protein
MKCFLIIALALALSHQTWAAEATPDATAKFLAGLPVRGTALESRSFDPEWATHAAELDRAWNRLEQEQLSKIRAWGPQFLGDFYNDRGPVFYMFSGPDFLYANAFFPNAQTYILCGKEPIGSIPNIENIPREALSATLGNLRKSLDSVLSWSFFISKQLRVDIAQTQLSGTLPVLYVFLARAGARIESASLVSVDDNGNIAENGQTPAAKIVFIKSDGTEQTLYYFTTDVSDDGIKSMPGFMKFCEKEAPGVSLLKASSYLMHEGGFAKVRDFLLSESKIVVQDDSGIPRKYFDDSKWNIRYCGNYLGPTPTFKQFFQPDLAKNYAETTPAPLGFGFGYEWQPNRSSLIVAVRKWLKVAGETRIRPATFQITTSPSARCHPELCGRLIPPGLHRDSNNKDTSGAKGHRDLRRRSLSYSPAC